MSDLDIRLKNDLYIGIRLGSRYRPHVTALACLLCDDLFNGLAVRRRTFRRLRCGDYSCPPYCYLRSMVGSYRNAADGGKLASARLVDRVVILRKGWEDREWT